MCGTGAYFLRPIRSVIVSERMGEARRSISASVSYTHLDIAAQALSPESVSLMHRRAAQCVMRKCELEVALEDLDGVEAVYPSASNFLLVRFVDAARVFTALRDRGIILRDQSRQPTLENCIRITVGTKDENERLLTELEEILKEAA